MMGMWFVGAAFGNLIAGLVAGRGGLDTEQVGQMPDLFWSIVLFCVGGGIFFLISSPFLKKWMGRCEII